jgi:hypothetical protein
MCVPGDPTGSVGALSKSPWHQGFPDKRISIENWDNTSEQFWSAAIGYASDDFFRIGYYIKP